MRRRPQRRLRPDPQGARSPASPRKAANTASSSAWSPAPGRARRHHPLAVQHAVRDAHGQRPRPGDRALRGLRCRRQPARLRALARHPRGVRLRRRRRAADAAEVQQLPAHQIPKSESAATSAKSSGPASTRTSSPRCSSAGAARPRASATSPTRHRRPRPQVEPDAAPLQPPQPAPAPSAPVLDPTVSVY